MKWSLYITESRKEDGKLIPGSGHISTTTDKVFAAEWRDLKDVFNMIGGIYPDIKKTIEFVD